MNQHFNTIIDGLSQNGLAVVDHFLPPVTYQALIQEALSYYHNNAMRRAGIGQKQAYTIDTSIRRDAIAWLDYDTASQCVQIYFDTIMALRKWMNQTLFLNLHDYEAHFAVFEPGGFFQAHRDQFKQSDLRQISCVYFLNQDWQQQHAGELVVHLEDHHQQVIQPLGNRFVCFQSHLLHQVNPTSQLRLSMTGWMKKFGVPLLDI